MPLQNRQPVPQTNWAVGTPWKPVDDNRETGSSASAVWEG